MNKVAIVYWSGTGNTEQMAQAVAEGVKNAGGEADVLTCSDFFAPVQDAEKTERKVISVKQFGRWRMKR